MCIDTKVVVFSYCKQRFTLLLFVVRILCSFVMFSVFDTHATLSDGKMKQ